MVGSRYETLCIALVYASKAFFSGHNLDRTAAMTVDLATAEVAGKPAEVVEAILAARLPEVAVTRPGEGEGTTIGSVNIYTR